MKGAEALPLVGATVKSVWALEVLIFLRAHRQTDWRADDLVKSLRASAPLVQEVLKLFETAGLVSQDAGHFRYAPASADIDAQCQMLEAAYQARPVAVINAIVASSTDDLRHFSDAFRMKGDT